LLWDIKQALSKAGTVPAEKEEQEVDSGFGSEASSIMNQ